MRQVDVVGDVPLTLFDVWRSFPGCSKAAVALADEDGAGFYEHEPAEIKKFFFGSVDTVSRSRRTSDVNIHDGIYSSGGEIVEQAKIVTDAAKAAGDEYERPDVKELQAIVDGGIKGLVDTLGDFGAYAWCPRLTAVVKQLRTRIKLP